MIRWDGTLGAICRAVQITSVKMHALFGCLVIRSGGWMRNAVAPVILLCTLAATMMHPAMANDTRTYLYDALGRLVKVAHSGTVNSMTAACYTYDHADNRTSVVVSTNGDCTNAPAVTFSVSDASVAEAGNLVFTVTKSGAASATTTIDYATSDGTAIAGSDYTAKTGTLSFLSTDTSKTVSVPTLDDSTVENSETVVLNLSNATGGAAISDGQGIGTIVDNDSDCVGISYTVTSNGAVVEGMDSVFTITKQGSTSKSCDVSYATASGTGTFPASSGSDFTATSGTVVFTATQTSQTVIVPTIDDAAAESSETFSLSLSNADRGATVQTASATATINDNDACAGVSFSVASNGPVTEGGGSVFTITKSGSSSFTCSVSYATADGSAVAAADYVAASGTLNFSSNATSIPVTVVTVDDGVAETTETFSLHLSSATGGGLVSTPSSATATINDNDSGGVCSGVGYAVNDASTTAGTPLTFTVTKTGSTSSSCTIAYATADGTAVAGQNYSATSGTLTFTPSQTSQNISVATIAAAFTKTMYLNLSTASDGASISDGQGVGTINTDSCRTCVQSVSPATSTTDSSSAGSGTDPPPNPPQ